MQLDTKLIARQAYLLMAIGSCIIMGLTGVLAGIVISADNPLSLIVSYDGALAAIFAGLGLLFAVTGRRWPGRFVAVVILVIAGNSLSDGLPAGAGDYSRLYPPVAAIFMLIALCLLLGREHPVARHGWRVTGASLLLAGLALVVAHWFTEVFSWLGPHPAAATITSLFMVVFGLALLLAAEWPAGQPLMLGRDSLMAGLFGILLSCLSWYQLSLDHNQSLRQQGEYTVANIKASVSQRLASQVQLLQRMADRWQSFERMPPANLLQADIRSYLRDIPSLESLMLLDSQHRLLWEQSRDTDGRGEQWLLNEPEVQGWLALSPSQTRMMIPDSSHRHDNRVLSLVALPLAGLDSEVSYLVGIVNLDMLLQPRMQLSPFMVFTSLVNHPLIERGETQPQGHHLLITETSAQLPYGPELRSVGYLGDFQALNRSANLLLGMALIGFTLSLLLVICLELIKLTLARSRDLSAAKLHLQSQQQIQDMIARDMPLKGTLEAICQLVEQQLPDSLCSILLLDGNGQTLSLAASISLPPGYQQGLNAIPVGAGICGSAAYHRAPVICENIATDARCTEYRELALAHGMRACWSHPVIATDDRVLGTFALYYRRPGSPGEPERRLIENAASLCALTLERYHYRRQLAESEQHYRSLFTYNPDAVFSLDLNGVLVTVNGIGCELLNLQEEEIIGRHFSELVEDDPLPDGELMFRAFMSGTPQRHELRSRVREGEQRILDVTSLPIVVDGRITGIYGIAKDITRRKRDEAWLQILQRSVEASINGIVIADARRPGLPIVYANPAFERISGYSEAEVLGQNSRFLQGPNTDSREVAKIRQGLAAQQEIHTTLRNYRKDGTPFWNDLYIAPVRDEQGQLSHFIGVQNDISDRKAQEAQLAHHANHDALTGLPNRSLLEDRLEQNCQLALRHGSHLVVLFIDLDGFKPINDSLGHIVGDQLLIEVAGRLLALMSPGDTVARFGGDEFVVLLTDLADPAESVVVIERILTALARPYLIERHEYSITASIGVTASGGNHLNPMQLIQQADMAMYKAKRQGRNHYQWYTDDINKKLGQLVVLRNELQEAIDHHHFELHYQPLIRRDGRVCSFEALLRWRHPVKGYISPAEFIPLAEDTGQIIPISQWVLERACRDTRTLSPDGDYRVAVNLSPLQFHRSNFLDALQHTLHGTGLPACCLELELTEGILMDNTQYAIGVLQSLREMAVSVAIDDFGTGFSSLSYLKNLPIGKIKIDRSFIQEVTSNPHDAAITQGIIAMAHQLGLEVVAEGIETQEQYQFLQRHGCDLFQGFYFARPMPLERLQAFLGERQAGSLSAAGHRVS
ncbi:hypothetical protein GCM10022394_03090 [Zobellella aerophila]|uniref:Bifunctional diguanylate cyclase/phosphodiesterase n=2 Tax=Zobellella aerophila TaxID=870480 RepID=A0ABP6V4V9_9GAMM